MNKYEKGILIIIIFMVVMVIIYGILVMLGCYDGVPPTVF